MNSTQIAEHNRLFQKAVGLIKDEIELADRPGSQDVSDQSALKLRSALTLLSQVVELNPVNWSAIWAIGKIHERLRDDRSALESFKAAGQIKPDHPDILRESCLAALRLGHVEAAVDSAQRAVQIEPGNAGLHANVALARILQRDLKAAAVSIDQALELDAKNEIAQRLARMVRHFTQSPDRLPSTLPALRAYWAAVESDNPWRAS